MNSFDSISNAINMDVDYSHPQNSDYFDAFNSPVNINFHSNDNSDLSNGYKPYEKRLETYIVPIVFAIIFIVGFVGNTLTILTIISEKMYKTPSYLYILNLAFGDLIVILGSLPFVATIYTFESWPYGWLICRLSEFIRDTSMAVTVFTLTIMAYDRYKATFAMRILNSTSHHRQYRQLTTLRYIYGVFVIWLASIAIGLPAGLNAFLWQIEIEPHRFIFICYPYPHQLGEWYPQLVISMKFCLLFLIPLMVICFCYTLIATELKKYALNCNQYTLNSYFHKRHKFRRTIVIFFVIAFVICFFPNHVFNIWFYFNPYSRDDYNDFWHVWRIISFILSFANSCINPIILYLTSIKFRHKFKCYLANCRTNNDNETMEESCSAMRTY